MILAIPPGSVRRRAATMGLVTVLLATLVACAGFRVERDGRKFGDAICDLKTASNSEEAQKALDDAQKWIDKAARTTGRPVSEDLRDIKENLSDLRKHALGGNRALAQQDIQAAQQFRHASRE